MRKPIILALFLFIFVISIGNVYGFTASYNFSDETNIWAYYDQDVLLDTSPPPNSGPHPSGTTEFTSQACLDTDNGNYCNIDIYQDFHTGFHLFKDKLDIEESDITLINWTWNGKVEDTDVDAYFYIWNDTGSSWDTCASMFSATLDADRFCDSGFNNQDVVNSSNYTHFVVHARNNDLNADRRLYVDYVSLEVEYDGIEINSLTNDQEILNTLSTTLNTSQSGYNQTIWYTWNKGIINTTLCTDSNECQDTITFPRQGIYNLTVYANKSDGSIAIDTVSDLFVGNQTVQEHADSNWTDNAFGWLNLEYDLTVDGVFSTYGEVHSGANTYGNLNYSFNPTYDNIVRTLTKWQVKDHERQTNLTIPTGCWNLSNNLQLRVGGVTNNIDWSCFDYSISSWLDVRTPSKGDRVYEDQIIWYYFSNNTAPTATLVTANNTNFTTSSFNISYNYTDDNDYVSNVQLYIDDTLNQSRGIQTDLDTNLNFTVDSISDGTYTYLVSITDSDGEITNSSKNTFTLDSTAPTSTPTMTSPPDGAGYTNNTWSANDVKITISATDGGGVGFDNTAYPEYCFDTTNTCTPNAFIGISGKTNTTEGTTYIRFRSVDYLGNTEDTQSRTLKIDKTPPNASIIFPTASLFLNYNTSINLNFSASDSLSGIDTCWYNLDNGENNTISCGTNATFNASEGSHTLYFFTNDTVNNINNSETISFTIDLTEPIPTIVYPENISYSENVSAINYTYTETNCDSVWWSNNSGTWNSTAIPCGTNFTTLTSVEGSNTWTLYMNDSANNENSTSVTFFKDTIFPQISIQTPTNYLNTTNNNLNINYTVSDANLDSCWWTNDTGANNYTLADCTNITTETWADGTHTIIVYTNDTVNNENSSSVTFTVDTTAPNLAIVHPLDTASYSTTTLDLNYTVSDDTIGIDTCWYRNNTDATNITIPCGTNTTISNTDGTHIVYMWANDTLGNTASTSNTYTISTSAPAISKIVPTDTQILNSQSVWFNYTSIDLNGVDTCQLWGNWTGIWHNNLSNVHGGDTSVDVSEGNFSQTIADGHYKWNIWCNDTNPTASFSPTNFTFTIDSTFPLIDFTADVSANDTNTTSTYIYVNVSVTELNEDTITFTLWNETAQINETSFTDGTRNITWYSLTDDIYYYNVTINDSANNINYTETRLIRLDDTKPTITLTSPLAQNYGDNNTIYLNHTTTDNLVGLKECSYLVYNKSGGSEDALIISATTLSNCENTTFQLPGRDIDYNLYLFAEDLLGNIQSTSVTFGIRTESPAVVLYPSNDTHSDSLTNNYFNFSVTTNANSISKCELWGDFNGTWYLNQTISSPAQSININFSALTLTERQHIWNVNCSDNFGHEGFALNNNSFTTDITYPSTNITEITTTEGSQTFEFDSTATDTHLDETKCKYSIFDSTGSIDGLNENVSFTCNVDESPTVTGFGTYNLTIYASDKAGNENSSTESFTTSQAQSTGGGGGGAVTEEELFPVISLKGINGTKTYRDIERAILYATINNFISEQLTGEPLALLDFSGQAFLTEEDLEIIMLRLLAFDVEISFDDLLLFFENYKNSNFDQTFTDQEKINKFGLLTRVLGITIPLEIFPPSVEKFVFIYEPSNQETVIPITLTANKEISSCDVISDTPALTCDIINGNKTIKLEYKIEGTNFVSRIFSGTVAVSTSTEDPNLIEQRRIQVGLRVINTGNPSSIGIGVIGIGTAVLLIFLRLKKSKKKPLNQVKDFLSTK